MHSEKCISFFYLRNSSLCTIFVVFLKQVAQIHYQNPFISVELRMDLLPKKKKHTNSNFLSIFPHVFLGVFFKANLFCLFFCFLFWEKRMLLKFCDGERSYWNEEKDVPTLFCQKRYVFLLFFGRTCWPRLRLFCVVSNRNS